MLLVTFHRQHLFRGHKRELRLQRATLQMVLFLIVEFHWAKAQVTLRNSSKWSMALSRHPGYFNQRQEVKTWEILTEGHSHSCVRTALHVGAEGGRSVHQRAVTRFCAFWFDCVVSGRWFQSIAMLVSLSPLSGEKPSKRANTSGFWKLFFFIIFSSFHNIGYKSLESSLLGFHDY